MKVILAAVNAKYIHSNLAVYSLKANCGQYEDQVELAEFSINQLSEDILKSIYQMQGDVVCFSCYIWNIQMVTQIARWLKLVSPKTSIWLGGPEVSFDVNERLELMPYIDGIMYGEGEETFKEMCAYWHQKIDQEAEVPAKADQKIGQGVALSVRADQQSKLYGLRLEDILGIGYRDVHGQVHMNPARPFLDMSTLRFVYKHPEDFNHKIIYYESSRGCPYQCSYCLSSVEKRVRFRSIDLVTKELQTFIDWRVPQVKFVDRTFNCDRKHSMAILEYIQAHDEGYTNFHFEITADLLTDEEIEFMAALRPGLIQLEIGVQSTNPETIREIRRNVAFEKLAGIVKKISVPGNIHQHLDLIAGLPWEGLERFKQSFDDVYALRPEQFQLGFLKALKGSYMRDRADDYGLVFRPEPPYEVLSTKWMSYEDILELKVIEDMVETYYNSRQFENALEWLSHRFDSAYAMYEAMGAYYAAHGLDGLSHSRLARYEILLDFVKEQICNKEMDEHLRSDMEETFRQILTLDLYLRENVKNRPGWTMTQEAYKSWNVDFFRDEANRDRYFSGYEAYNTKQIQNMTHMEHMTIDPAASAARGETVKRNVVLWFDYKHRDPLTSRAAVVEV